MKPEVTILVPNYRTLKLTKLCLRLIRKYTPADRAHVIVIDNDSADESTEYLRSLDWIELIERKTDNDPSPQKSHANALDEAMARVDTPYVLSFHTDTMVKKAGWLDFLLKEFNSDKVAGVGSWKLESKPWIKRVAKRIEYQWQSFYYPLIGKTDHRLEGKGKNYYYLRSHLAMYRTEVLREHDLHFGDDDMTVGKAMHNALLAKGYEMKFLPSETLGQYADHLNHATLILNPELGARDATIKKGLKRIKRGLEVLNADLILQDETLDR